jgi:hypothetical protein
MSELHDYPICDLCDRSKLLALPNIGYKSYENVWLELKSMGDQVDTLVDNNTLGGIHFG